MIMEKWKWIRGYKGKYKVSTHGRVKSVNRILICKNGVVKYRLGRILKQSTVDGYKYVNLGFNIKHRNKSVHRMVAFTFILNPENKGDVNHKDLNKCNNAITNLEWATRLENVRHAMSNGIQMGRRKKGNI